MKEWLKSHVLEIASLVMTIVGVKGLIDFWSRLCEMFSSYSVEALFACGLAAAATAIAASFLARSGYRRKLAAKDVVIATLEADMERRIDEGIKEHMECLMDALYKKMRAARDPDSVIRDRIASRSLDGHSVLVLNIVLETGIYERRWLRDALNDGFVVVREDDLSRHDEGWYFRDLVDDDGACSDGYGAPSRRFKIKQDVADVLSANPEVFAIVEREDEALSDLVRYQNNRAARGRMRKSQGAGES